MKKQLIINLEDNEVSIHTMGKLTYSDITELMGTAQLLAFNNVMKDAPFKTPHQEQEMKEHLWELYNGTASNILDEMIPEHMRKDLTEEAILDLENKILKQ